MDASAWCAPPVTITGLGRLADHAVAADPPMSRPAGIEAGLMRIPRTPPTTPWHRGTTSTGTCTDAGTAITRGKWAAVPSESRGRADWARLTAFLTARPEDEDSVTLSWAELDQIVGGVPASAVRHYPQWWHGDRSHVRAWKSAGYTAVRIRPGRSVTFRRSGGNPAAHGTGRRQEKPTAVSTTSNGDLRTLQEIDPRDALLVIPCSGKKRTHGSAESSEAASWPSELLAARACNRAAAKMDEQQLMPAWYRYNGWFYTTAEASLRDAVFTGAPLAILSGGYGLLHPEEPTGHYNKAMRLTDWPTGLLEELLMAEADRRNVSAVVAFAAAKTDYAKLVRRTPWRSAGLMAYLVTINGVSKGAQREVPRRLGHAFTCFWQRQPAGRYPEGTTVERLA
ncbi:DUF7662 domain-containing protein [Thermomonospora cellulosilytica]|uniref:DUF7662 domain-containing protein n=1 Tax=Thermomonospora cellulosilytica TaxID=1411118 RepID=UPI00406C1031